MTCFHLKKSSVFSFKPEGKKFAPFKTQTATGLQVSKGADSKDAKPDSKDAKPPSKEEPSIACPLCYAIGFRSAFRETLPGTHRFFVKDPKAKAVPADVDEASFAAGVEAFEKLGGQVQRILPWGGDDQKYDKPTSKKLVFDIRADENGETYHGLIAALIDSQVTLNLGTTVSPKKDAPKPAPTQAPKDGKDSKEPQRKTAASQAQKEFLGYYLPSEQLQEGATRESGGRKACTQLIADFFKLNLEHQEELHQGIRDYLSDRVLSTAIATRQNPYVTMSYLSKFYVNRFLGESKQEFASKAKLPKAAQVGLVALVLVRRGHAAQDARSMSKENLKEVLKCFLEANKREASKVSPSASKSAAQDEAKAPKVPEQAITHVILSGDLDPLEFAELQKQYPPGDKTKGFTFIYLPSPFLNSEPIQKMQTLQALRGVLGGVEDHAPVEAKVLSIFIALQERYQDKLFVVGFRSGTLDGAGFLGIPVIYFDDLTFNDEKAFKERYESGKYLFSNELDKTSDERILQLTRAINTFIRVNIRPTMAAKSKDILLDETARRHLVMALRQWIFGRVPSKRGNVPRWKQRLQVIQKFDPKAIEAALKFYAS